VDTGRARTGNRAALIDQRLACGINLDIARRLQFAVCVIKGSAAKGQPAVAGQLHLNVVQIVGLQRRQISRRDKTVLV
ncbi:hypothetical protein QCD69_22640, partial [Erwinia sp. PsM31]